MKFLEQILLNWLKCPLRSGKPYKWEKCAGEGRLPGAIVGIVMNRRGPAVVTIWEWGLVLQRLPMFKKHCLKKKMCNVSGFIEHHASQLKHIYGPDGACRWSVYRPLYLLVAYFPEVNGCPNCSSRLYYFFKNSYQIYLMCTCSQTFS